MVVFTTTLCFCKNSFSQRDFLRLDEGTKAKIEFDNHSKKTADKIAIISVFDIQLQRALNAAEVELISQELIDNNIYLYEYETNSKAIVFFKKNDSSIDSIKNILYSKDIEISDYTTSYAIEK